MILLFDQMPTYFYSLFYLERTHNFTHFFLLSLQGQSTIAKLGRLVHSLNKYSYVETGYSVHCTLLAIHYTQRENSKLVEDILTCIALSKFKTT